MSTRTTTTISLLLSLALLTVCEAQRRTGSLRATGERAVMTHDGKERQYRLHVPKRRPPETGRPLVVVLHGGGGDADQASRMGFTPLADKEGFIVVYPEGTDKNWNDGRKGKALIEKAGDNDDVGFITALIEKISRSHKIDKRRIYVTGVSNGGIMSHRLGIEKADVFAAIAPVIGGVAKDLGTAKKFRPSEPLSVLIIQGTEDPLTRYDGGPIGFFGSPRNGTGRRGSIIPTNKAIELWNQANGILGKPKVERLPDLDSLDGCTLERSDWPAGRKGSKVSLIRMIGAGHTMPGARQYLPEKLVGKTCYDANGPELIWEFFKANPKSVPSD